MSDPSGYHEIKTVRFEPSEHFGLLLENGWKVVGVVTTLQGMSHMHNGVHYLVLSYWHGAHKKEKGT